MWPLLISQKLFFLKSSPILVILTSFSFLCEPRTIYFPLRLIQTTFLSITAKTRIEIVEIITHDSRWTVCKDGMSHSV